MEVYYKPSDIVWVKLGPFWWPGEVVDKTGVPDDIIESLKREPVAIVKFFDDDGYYEIVKNPEHIFPYNCERKYDFIKKGMDAFRAKNSKLASFPKDVSAAEIKTGGNANILSDPVFTTERKRNYAAEIFGSPTVKKPRDSLNKAIKSEPIITHRRFLGYDDYEARVLILSPEEKIEEEKDLPPPLPKEDGINKFTCPVCQFCTDRLGILMKHTSCHIKDVSFQSRQPLKKPQKRKRRKALSDDDLSGDEKKTKAKRKYTKKKVEESLLADDERSENDMSLSVKDSPKRKYTKKSVQPVVEEKKDICTDIIADWDDESNHEDSNENETTLDSTLNETLETSEVTGNESSLVDSLVVPQDTEEDLDLTRITKDISDDGEKPENKTEKSPNKSCFDFDDDEEDTKIPNATSGRKIPRVIPISERRKTFEFDEEPEDEEEEKKKKKILEESEELAKLTETSTVSDKESESLEKTYQSLMDSTESINLPDVPNVLKNEQNFHSPKTVKYPDKTKDESADLIEAEVVEEKMEETEKSDTLEKTSIIEGSIGESSSKETPSIVDNKMEEPSELVQSEEKKVVDDEVEISSKGKTNRKSKHTKRGRKSKLEVTESALDALLLKQAEEQAENSKHDEESEFTTIQVPLSLSSVEPEGAAKVIPAESTEIQDSSCELDKEKSEIKKKKIIKSDLVDEKNEGDTLSVNKTDEKQSNEIPVKCSTEELGQCSDTSEEKTVSMMTLEDSAMKELPEAVEIQKEINIEVAKKELDDNKDKVEDNEQPKSKRRKTHTSSRSSRSSENPTHNTRRAHKDSKITELEENLKIVSPKSTIQAKSKSRKSSESERKSLNKDDMNEDYALEECSIPSPEEINNVIFGSAHNKECMTSHIEKPPSVPEKEMESPLKTEEKKDSVDLPVPCDTSIIEQQDEPEENKKLEKKEQIVSEQESEKSKTNRNNHVDEIPDGKLEKNSDKPTQDNKSSQKSSRTEKRSSRSDKDHKKSDSSMILDDSSHRSSRSGRRSSRHEKEKQASSESSKTTQQDETPSKHPKESSNSRKSHGSSSRDTHTQSLDDKEDDVLNKSSKKGKKTDQDSQKHKVSPVKDDHVDDKRDHISSSHSSKRRSRSTRSSKDLFKSPEKKQSEESYSSKKEKILEKPQSSHMKLAGSLKRHEVDPIKDLFSPSDSVVKTKEQKREELKNIFSFDYDEKDLRKRRTYGHKRKSKQEKPTEESKIEVPSESKQLNSAESKNEDVGCKTIENTGQTSSVVTETTLVDEQKSDIPILDTTPENYQQVSEKSEVQNETVLDINKKEKSLITEQKNSSGVSELQATESSVRLAGPEVDTSTQIEMKPSIEESQKNETIEIVEKKIEEVIPHNEAGSDICKDSSTELTSHDDKEKIHDNLSKDSAPKLETEKSVKVTPKKIRKPSRWDQKEKINTDSNQAHKSRWDKVENEESNQVSNSEIEPTKENIIDEKAQITVDIDETSQKEMREIFSNRETFNLAEKNAEQIELIFGSSPLPGSTEDNNFPEERENLEKISDKKESSVSNLEEKKKEETISSDISSQNSSFEHASDIMESVESQVARITHYEEPNVEVVPKEETSSKQEKVGSIFDTPETPSNKCLDIVENTVDVETISPTEKCSSESSESSSKTKLESSLTSAPKTKKTYLLTEKARMEKEEESSSIPKEQSTSTTDSTAQTKSPEKTHEVATKLTNPKKRFVKSFEDFELNQQKEKTLEAEKTIALESKSEQSSLPVGKSPIVFRLKKQFLSKISNIFDEADEKKETKLLPKLKPTRSSDGTAFAVKKKLPSEKTESTCTKSSKKPECPELKTEKSSQLDNDSDSVIPVKESDAEVSNSVPPKSNTEKDDFSQEMSGQCDVKAQTNDNSAMNVDTTSTQNSSEISLNSTAHNTDTYEKLSLPVSEAQVIIEKHMENEEHVIDISKTEIITKNFPLDENKKEDTEYVSIDGNLTVVSEKELAEGQVEITATMPSKKPMTLLSFSMDFSDDSSDASFEVFRKEKIQNITESLESKSVEDENKEKEKVSNEKKDHTTENAEKIETTVNEEKAEDVDNENKKPIVDKKEIEQEIEVEQKKQALDGESTAETIFDKNEHIDHETEHVLVNKEELLESKPNVIGESKEIESSLATVSPLEEKNDKTETKREETNILESSTSKTTDDIKEADSEKCIRSEVKTPSKSSESVPIRSKGRESSKKKLLTPEAVPVVNEPVVIYNTAKSSTVTDLCDLEDHIPSQIVCTKNALINEEVMKVAGINNEITKESIIPSAEPEMSKLLSRLTTDKKEDPISKIKTIDTGAKMKELESKALKTDQAFSKNLLKAAVKSKSINTNVIPPSKSANKAIILSEKIIRPAREVTSVNAAPKRSYEDVEDIEPYVITKAPKLEPKKDEISGSQKVPASTAAKLPLASQKQFILNANKQIVGIKKSAGKAKIINQTIIRPAVEANPNKVLTGTEDNVDFDINSMPIVLSDELLTPETLENIPIVLGEQTQKIVPASENMKIVIDKKAHISSKLMSKTVPSSAATAGSPTIRMPIMKRAAPKILQTPKPAQKIIRQVTPSVSSKSGKFVVVSDSPNRPTQLMKKQPNLLRRTIPVTCAASGTQSNPSETTGHKIMIFTNQQGKQQRLLLTPAQQKMFGMQLPGKTVVKSATVAQKSQLGKIQTTSLASTSKLSGQTIQSSKLVKTTLGATQIASPHMKIVAPRKTQKVFMSGGQGNKPPQQKTILITNQHGQTVRKIQGTNEALLDKQVAEQLEAIKVSSMKAQQKQLEANAKAAAANKLSTVPTRKSIAKRPEPKQTPPTKPPHQSMSTISGPSRLSEQRVPPLTPIRQEKKPEDLQIQTTQAKPVQQKPERPLHQLVIQDNMGNQTTITEGQILALPSETVDGQPQSYMLVTLDETGNLTPLNNEALMSLDPSLAGLAGGDLSNMVLQMDAGTSKDNVGQTVQLQTAPPTPTIQEKPKQELKQQVSPPKPVQQVVAPVEQVSTQVQVTCNINGEPGQQIILTGDAAATQKFLDSLSDGSTDLTNILAGAEGNSFLIQTDGQQILINTDPSEAPLLQHNANIVEQPEQGNPMFSSHPVKNQDILAAALADTDVFQQDQGKMTHSQLSPGQTLFPMNVGNVLETSLTLNSPIMTPLEVPSTNSKRIPDEEADILTTHVPKNVDLPITITDPNISQTVSHQQVLMASDLQSNLELSLPISETSMSVTSDMNSPSFVYSLPNLDVSEHAEISQKTFSSSMPLLTEELEESTSFVPVSTKTVELQSSTILDGTESVVVTEKHNSERIQQQGIVDSMSSRRMVPDGTFIGEGLCTLGAEMCSSLSEPPPEMFDIPMENDGLNFLNKSQNDSKEKSELSTVESSLLTDDNSLEISVQSQIVSDFKDSSQSSDSLSSVSQDKTL